MCLAFTASHPYISFPFIWYCTEWQCKVWEGCKQRQGVEAQGVILCSKSREASVSCSCCFFLLLLFLIKLIVILLWIESSGKDSFTLTNSCDCWLLYYYVIFHQPGWRASGWWHQSACSWHSHSFRHLSNTIRKFRFFSKLILQPRRRYFGN